MIYKTIKGDLIELSDNDRFDVMVHGCNCFNNFGAGIALQVKNKWVEAYEVDQLTTPGLESKLGSFTTSFVKNAKNKDLLVVNMYTQYMYGYNKEGIPPCDYTAIFKGFFRLNKVLGPNRPRLRIGIPLIGAGLAGGNWEVIQKLINMATPDLDITVVEYIPPIKKAI